MEHDIIAFILHLSFPDVGETGLDCLRAVPTRAYLYTLALVNSTLHGQTLSPHGRYPRSVPLIFQAIRTYIVHAALQDFSREYLLEQSGYEHNYPPLHMLWTTEDETIEQLRQAFTQAPTAVATTTQQKKTK